VLISNTKVKDLVHTSSSCSHFGLEKGDARGEHEENYGRRVADGPHRLHAEHLLSEVRRVVAPFEHEAEHLLRLGGHQVAVVDDHDTEAMQPYPQRCHL
jgi:hypothetical protein